MFSDINNLKVKIVSETLKKTKNDLIEIIDKVKLIPSLNS